MPKRYIGKHFTCMSHRFGLTRSSTYKLCDMRISPILAEKALILLFSAPN